MPPPPFSIPPSPLCISLHRVIFFYLPLLFHLCPFLQFLISFPLILHLPPSPPAASSRPTPSFRPHSPPPPPPPRRPLPPIQLSRVPNNCLSGFKRFLMAVDQRNYVYRTWTHDYNSHQLDLLAASPLSLPACLGAARPLPQI